jgi:hypothetical protein
MKRHQQTNGDPRYDKMNYYYLKVTTANNPNESSLLSRLLLLIRNFAWASLLVHWLKTITFYSTFAVAGSYLFDREHPKSIVKEARGRSFCGIRIVLPIKQ